MSQAYRVSKNVALPETVIRCLREDGEHDENDPIAQPDATIGGFLSSVSFAWYANGPRLEVVNSKNGAKVAAWKFGSILKDTTTRVVCVVEVPIFNIDLPLLVVGLECALTGGSICIFDIVTSKVLRVIQLTDKVTSLCVINGGDGIFSTLGPLQAFDGIVAVGTVGGEVYLLDLCRQSIDDARYASGTHEIKDELDACEITVLTAGDIEEIELHKQRAAQLGNHLAIHLNAIERHNSPHFVLKGPSGEDRIHANKTEVVVSALHYSSQLGSVLVGYNFGAFQMWNVINMELVYTSPVYEGNVPISNFAVQEPIDDPRIFCYVWAVYSNTEPYQIGFPVAVLYALNFECKEWHDGYGYLYERFQSCTVRFQNELCLPHLATCKSKPKGGQCLRLHAFNKSGKSSRNSMSESQEDALTICWTVWNVWCRDNCEHTFMSIFDLNQWYKEQLPVTPEPDKYKSYMSYVNLSELVLDAITTGSPILDAHINKATINQFVGAQKLEEHYYPSTLAFECNACTDTNIVCVSSQGQQRAFLSFVEKNASLSLLKPQEIFEESIALGLTPLFMEPPQATSVVFQREQILSVILEQQMLSCLCKCISNWSNGSYTSAGCSPEFFLSWAWSRTHVLKSNANKLCVPLFDYSGSKLDANSRRMLNNCYKQLSNLSILYEFMCTKLTHFLPNAEIVHHQWNSIHLASVYLEVLQWLLNVGLLPEYDVAMHKQVEQSDLLSAPYPADSLLLYYSERREYLQTLNIQKFSSDRSLLFIDNLIDLECGGDALHNQWKTDGSGLYPPQSLQSLLLTYTVEDAELTCKHCVIFYVFLDLAMALDQERYKMVISRLIKFPAVFKLSPSVIKITQAFWQLDHGDFETAMELLLDAQIYPGDLKTWHHRIVLNALYVQGQHNFALLYLQVRKPPLSDVEDLHIAISLFVCNNLLDEAIHYQRSNSTKENEALLLRHVFQECNRNSKVKQLVTCNLNQCEEEALMKYLEEVNHPDLEQFQVVYYLQRSRYLDIFEMQGGKPSQQKGLVGQRNLNFKDEVTKALSNLFPKISRSLINVCQQERQSLIVRSERPRPMSCAVHEAKSSAKYKSTLIHGILKARETWTNTYVNDKLSNEGTPFLRTPVFTPQRANSKLAVISQTLINPDDTSLDDSEIASPLKKLKLTPRQSLHTSRKLSKTFFTVSSLTHSIRLDTPVVKRKFQKSRDSLDLGQKFNAPQSILKVRNLMSHSDQESPATSQAREIPLKPTKALKISPRKSLSRSMVRFEMLSNSPEKFGDETVSNGDAILSTPEEESSSVGLIEDVSVALVDSSWPAEVRDTSETSIDVPEKKKKYPTTPRSRRSYRDQSSLLSSDGVQTRFRTRLSSQDFSPSLSESPKKTTPSKLRRTSSTGPKGRKSLSRQVLENNAYATINSSLTASHTVEKHHMHVEETSTDQRKLIGDFSKHVSDLSVRIEDSTSERTSLIHTEVQNSSSVQVLEESDDSLTFTDVSDLNLTTHSLGLPSFIYDRFDSPAASPTVKQGENTTKQPPQEPKVQDDGIKSATDGEGSEIVTERNDQKSTHGQREIITAGDEKEQNYTMIEAHSKVGDNGMVLADDEQQIDNENSEAVHEKQEGENTGEFEVNEQTASDFELSKNPLENNVYVVDEEEEDDPNNDQVDDEVRDEAESAVDVTDDIYKDIEEQSVELNQNPLENAFYLVDEQEDDNLNVSVVKEIATANAEDERPYEIEIIEIPDSSEESDSLGRSSDSKESGECEEEEDVEDESESEGDSESTVELPTNRRESGGEDIQSEDKILTPQESNTLQVEEAEKNSVCEAPPSSTIHPTTDVNVEEQTQDKANVGDVGENYVGVQNGNEIENENCADVLDLSCNVHPLETTQADTLETPSAEKPAADLSRDTETMAPAAASKDLALNKTNVLDDSAQYLLLEITSGDVLDATLPSATFVRITDSTGESRKDESTQPGYSKTTRFRNRVSSCDLDSSPAKSTKTRKRSASVHESTKTELAEDLSNRAKKVVVPTPPKKPLRRSSTSDIAQLEDSGNTRPASRSRRAASISLDVPPTSSRRAKSMRNLPAITEAEGEQKHESSSDVFEEYSTSRRLTRRQKSMLEKSAVGALKELEGKIDADETSSHSSITEGGGKPRKRTQSQSESVSSLVSTVASASDVGSPKRSKGRGRTLSTSSTTSTDHYLRSSSSSVKKRIPKMSPDTGSEGSPDIRRSARIRLRSTTPEKLSDSESVASRTSARRRLLSTELDLSQIREENIGDSDTEEAEDRKDRKRNSKSAKK